MRRLGMISLIFIILMPTAMYALSTGGNEMIGGLAGLEMISAGQAGRFPQASGAIEICIDGAQLPYDSASNTYFIPQSGQSDAFEGTLEIERLNGWKYYLCPGADVDKQDAIDRSIGYTVYGVNGESCVSSKIIFTSLPVLCITTQSGELPTDADAPGELSIFSAVSGDIRLENTGIEINLRGNTSQRLPKKSYRVKIIDEYGKKENLSIAGLRSDDDWILNPLYADTSKIREYLAYSLWAEMNSSGTDAASSRMEYAEVFINGNYWGLYGVQERIDRKQVDASKASGVLYKVIANDRPSVEELLACKDGAICRSFELEFSGEGVSDAWEPAAAYMATLEGEMIETDSALSMRNVIDYGLWAMLTQAHDCHFKNQFIHGVFNGSGHTLYKIPWDLNNTFGDVWNNDAADENYTNYRIGKLVMDGSFEALVNSGDAETLAAIQARWAELRSGAIQAESILKRANEIRSFLNPAIERDSRRWPECGMGNGNARNIRDIEDFINTTIPRMDAYIAALGNAQ